MFLIGPVIKGIIIVLLGLLEMLGWKRASKWLDQLVGNVNQEKPVV
jgi:hypothetical protein